MAVWEGLTGALGAIPSKMNRTCPREFRATEGEMYEQRLTCCICIL